MSALSCPGDAAFRELAGIRVVQRRWSDAADLAAAALTRPVGRVVRGAPRDRAVCDRDDPLGALDAWNQAHEPRIDLIRVDGLTRTRYDVVQHLIGLKTGDTLTRSALLRGRRRLNELPSGSGTLDFVPVPSGLAEVRATVVERSLVPHGGFDLGVLGLATAVTREVVASIASPTGGGERMVVDWRFWAHRPLYRLSLAAPAPWRGVWTLGASRERQPFSAVLAPTVHDSRFNSTSRTGRPGRSGGSSAQDSIGGTAPAHSEPPPPVCASSRRAIVSTLARSCVRGSAAAASSSEERPVSSRGPRRE